MDGVGLRIAPRASSAVAWAAVLATMGSVVFAMRAPGLQNFAPLSQRILWFHVPFAVLAYVTFAVALAASAAYLATRRARWDLLAAACAEVGVLFAFLATVTGIAWARVDFPEYRPLADPKLVSVVALTLVYAGYLALRAGVAEESRRARLAAVFGIVAFLGVPVAYLTSASGRFATVHPAPTAVEDIRALLLVALLLLVPLAAHLVLTRMRLLDLERRVPSDPPAPAGPVSPEA